MEIRRRTETPRGDQHQRRLARIIHDLFQAMRRKLVGVQAPPGGGQLNPILLLVIQRSAHLDLSRATSPLTLWFQRQRRGDRAGGGASRNDANRFRRRPPPQMGDRWPGADSPRAAETVGAEYTVESDRDESRDGNHRHGNMDCEIGTGWRLITQLTGAIPGPGSLR